MRRRGELKRARTPVRNFRYPEGVALPCSGNTRPPPRGSRGINIVQTQTNRIICVELRCPYLGFDVATKWDKVSPMSKQRVFLFGVSLLLVGCGDKGDSKSAEKGGAAPAGEASKTAAVEAPKKPAFEVPAELKERPGKGPIRSIRPIGWSPDGATFAYQQTSFEWDAEKKKRYAMVQTVELIDALSGDHIKRYVVRKANDAPATFLAEASGEWDPEMARGKLDAIGVRPPGVELNFSTLNYSRSNASIAPLTFKKMKGKDGVEWTWGDKSRGGIPTELPKRGVRVQAKVKSDQWSARIFDTRIRRTKSKTENCNILREGTLVPIFDPTGTRVAIVMNDTTQPMFPGEYGYESCTTASVNLRTLSPQVGVSNYGAGALNTRKIAANLQASGTPVFGIFDEDEEDHLDTSKVQYRGDAMNIAEAVGQKIKVAVDPEKVKKAGWSDVIVALGKDLQSSDIAIEGEAFTPAAAGSYQRSTFLGSSPKSEVAADETWVVIGCSVAKKRDQDGAKADKRIKEFQESGFSTAVVVDADTPEYSNFTEGMWACSLGAFKTREEALKLSRLAKSMGFKTYAKQRVK